MGLSLAYLHVGRSHLPLAFGECSGGFVESLVHKIRRVQWEMSPSWTALLLYWTGNAADRLGSSQAQKFHAITCRRPNVALRHRFTRFTMSLPARLQAASSEYQRLQTDLSNVVESRQRLDAQLSENELVNKVREPSLLQ
jgi:hypothetical protein